MVLISHRYKFIYLKNFKVAGSSVESFFGQYCIDLSEKYSFEDKYNENISEYGILSSRMNNTPSSNVKWYNHMSALQVKDNIGGEMFNNYFKFCVVRNPYDLMVSAYFWRLHHRDFNGAFNEFIKHFSHTINTDNTRRIFINNVPICDYYIRYESLLDDIKNVCEKIGIKDYNLNDLPNHKSGIRPKGLSYRDYYDEETRLIVYNLFKKEFELFAYEF